MSEVREGSLFRATAADGVVRIVAVDVLAAALETQERHSLGSGSARLGADAVVAAALMSAHIKGDERMALQIQGEKPRLSVFAEVDADGRVRARITPPTVRTGPDGEINGVLVAAKSNARKEMYRGATEVAEANLESALREHLGASAQLDSVLRIRTVLGSDGTITSARGVLVEKLPGHGLDAEEMRAISVLEVLKDRTTDEIFEALDAGKLLTEPLEILEWRAVRWTCHCSREKVTGALVSLGAQEVHAMADEDDGAEVSCHFCNETYRFTADELRALVR